MIKLRHGSYTLLYNGGSTIHVFDAQGNDVPVLGKLKRDMKGEELDKIISNSGRDKK